MAELMVELPCPECRGERLKPEFRAVRWRGKSLFDLCRLSIRSLKEFASWSLDATEGQNPGNPAKNSRNGTRFAGVSNPLLAEIIPRLERLIDAGLDYLTLDRPVATLSGGEFRRLLLTSQLGGELSGVTYLLDEPTIGLHSRDSTRLIELLKTLRDRGNTVIVVEHDPEVIKAADHLIELGPGPGTKGGSLIAQGPWSIVRNAPESLLSRWFGENAPWPDFDANQLWEPGIKIRGATRHNLQNIDVDIPLGGMVVITGVSGSGKSTLVEDVLVPSFQLKRPVACRSFEVPEGIDVLQMVDQQMSMGAPNSLVATMTGILDPVRALFAGTDESRRLGISAAAFSPFSPSGRCPACQGSGGEQVDLDFLGGVRLVCEECGGSRFCPEILACTFRELTIADVFHLSVDEARERFADEKTLMPFLEALVQVGLGHIALGRSTDTLSAGERQRLRLGLGLIDHFRRKKSAERRLFLFDEPTTGLHVSDVAHLLQVFHDLIKAGHSLVVVEHHLEVIRRADWIIDLGPGGGEEGGRVVVAGTPDRVKAHLISATGAAMRG